MINPSTLALGTNRSTIMELAEHGRRRAAIVGKENVFDFSMGNPAVPAPAEVNAAIVEILCTTDSLAVHGYTPLFGDPQTRSVIAEDLNARFHCNAKAEELMLCCGAAPELAAVCKALTVDGAEILAIAPYFPEYIHYVQQAGASFRVVPADIPNFQIDLAAVESLLNPNTSAIIINNPNNPAGTIYSAASIESLAALLQRKSQEYGHAIYIIADEPYRELAYDGVEVPFIPNIYPNTVVCYSYSKSLSLPGERIGYIYVPECAADQKALLASIAGAARSAGHVCAPSLLQKVLAKCAHLRPDVAAYDQKRRILMDGLLAMGYEMAKPDGAFYIFLKAPNGDDRAFSKLAMEKDLLLVPGSDFGCPGYLRLCYCVSQQTIEGSLPKFKELLEEVR